jgi:HD-GYP domain-containing protein (c-di-GMP phosphodiesterase class II)/putative methionine-R-sulfoxide reductase with GAF domain
MEESKNQAQAEVLVTLSNQLDLAGKGLNSVLTTLTETVGRSLDVDQVSIWQFSPMSLEVRCINLHSRFEAARPYIQIDLTPRKAYLISLQTDQAITCADVAFDKRVMELPPTFWIDTKIKACLHVPVRAANQVMGILRIDSRGERAWTDADIQFGTHAADLVAQLLLSNELLARNDRTDALRSLSTDLTHRYELSTLLSDVVRKSAEMLGASLGTLFLVDPERRMIISAAGYNNPPEQTNQTFRYGEHIAGKVAETGQELLIKDYRSWPGRTEEIKKTEPHTTILAVPLRTHGEILGVLQLTRRDGNQPFMKSDYETLAGFANLACLAIEHRRLVETNHRLSQFQDSMKQIVETTTFASSVADFLETITDYLTHALSAPLAVIHIEDVFTMRGFHPDSHQKIEAVLMKRGKRFNPVTVVHDISVSDGGYRDLAEIMQEQGVQAYILAPIPMNHERVGYVCIASNPSRTWAADEKQMVEIAAYQIGLAIEGIRFYQETQSQIDIIKRMSSITSALNRLVPMDVLIPLIGEGAVRLFNADSLGVVLREKDDIVRASWVFGVSKPEFMQAINEDGKELLKFFAAVVEPMLVTNISKSSLPKQLKNYLMSVNIKAVKLAPIVYSGNVKGVIAGFYEKIVDWPPRDRQMVITYTNTVALALQNTWSYEQLETGYLDLAVSLTEAIEARESRVKAASVRVAELAQRTAQLIGLPREEQDSLRLAALLHDIGKVEVPDEIIQKPGLLSGEEKLQLQHYPLKSEHLVSPLSSHREIGSILRCIREHYDGSGYPDQRKGADIPLAARILSVVDAYSSMLDARPYRSALTHEAAVDEIMKNSGKQFDPQVVNAFLQAVNNQTQFVN